MQASASHTLAGKVRLFEFVMACSSSSKMYCHIRIPGREDFRLQSIVWSPLREHAGRLFGISLHGVIFEVG